MSTPNGHGPRALVLREGDPVEQVPQTPQPGPGVPGIIRQPVQIAPDGPQRFDLKIHATDGTEILRLYEREDGTFAAEADMRRLDEAATMFVNQVAAMTGRRILHATAHPDSPGAWLARQPLGPVIQPVAANIMAMAWHAALEAGLCDCPQCAVPQTPPQIGSTPA